MYIASNYHRFIKPPCSYMPKELYRNRLLAGTDTSHKRQPAEFGQPCIHLHSCTSCILLSAHSCIAHISVGHCLSRSAQQVALNHLPGTIAHCALAELGPAYIAGHAKH